MPVSAEKIGCLVVFKLPEGEFWFGNKMPFVATALSQHGPTRRFYKNADKTELYITGTADEQITSAIMGAVKGARWEVVTDIDVIRKLVPAEFQFVL